MSDDILVRCCAINVVRRDAGALWADRTANRAIARKAQEVVLAALDGWLAPLLAERAAGCAVFDEIRMELTINPAELAGAAPFVRSRLRAQLAQALAAAAIVPAAADRMEHTGATNSGRKERPGEGHAHDHRHEDLVLGGDGAVAENTLALGHVGRDELRIARLQGLDPRR